MYYNGISTNRGTNCLNKIILSLSNVCVCIMDTQMYKFLVLIFNQFTSEFIPV